MMKPSRSDIALLAAVAVLLALFMLKGAAFAPPPVPAASEFDVDRALARLQRILGDERPHPVDSAANDAVRARLIAEIEALGHEPEVRDDFSCRASARWKAMACARVRNIVFRAGPPEGDAALIASHYDSVPAGPGAADDGAGVAAALEIAALLSRRPPAKAVIFLISDGEEQGLLGAASFVRKDELAHDVAAVINMEARGVAGPAVLFETGDPNGRELGAYRRVRDPFGNSLAGEIYKRMPNDTDMSEFLKLRPDALNLAFAGRVELYHTPKDDLQHLDRRSLAHLGASALASLKGYLAARPQDQTAKEPRTIYADIAGKALLLLPQWAGIAMTVLGLGAAALTFARGEGPTPVRSSLAPFAAMIVAGLVAFGAMSVVDAVRKEASFWSAHPEWTRAVIYLSGLFGGAMAMAFAGEADRNRVLSASWFAFALVGAVACSLAPGAAILTGVPAGLFFCAALASLGAPRLFAPLSLIALAAALILWLPALAGAEQGLGLGAAWPFAIVAALFFMLAAPVVTPSGRIGAVARYAPAAALIAAILIAIAAPAYSPAAPRPLNIAHVATGDRSFFSLGASAEPAPKEMAALAAFRLRTIEGLSEKRLAAPAPAHDGIPVGLAVKSAVMQEVGRTITLAVEANGADEVVVTIPDEAAAIEATIGGKPMRFDEKGAMTIRCAGRACAKFEARVVVGRTPSEWTIYGVRYGLGADGAALAAARPASAIPVHNGDVRIVISKARI